MVVWLLRVIWLCVFWLNRVSRIWCRCVLIWSVICWCGVVSRLSWRIVMVNLVWILFKWLVSWLLFSVM